MRSKENNVLYMSECYSSAERNCNKLGQTGSLLDIKFKQNIKCSINRKCMESVPGFNILLGNHSCLAQETRVSKSSV
jgi:hypothetical protein